MRENWRNKVRATRNASLSKNERWMFLSLYFLGMTVYVMICSFHFIIQKVIICWDGLRLDNGYPNIHYISCTCHLIIRSFGRLNFRNYCYWIAIFFNGYYIFLSKPLNSINVEKAISILRAYYILPPSH